MASLEHVEVGSKIRLDYTLSTEEELIDSTEGVGPLTLTVGNQEIHPAIEKCLIGRRIGESFEIWLDPSLAFGEWDPSLQSVLNKKDYPQAFDNLKAGDHFESQDSRGKKRLYRVVRIAGDQLFVDGNHPLAGKSIELRATVLGLF